MGVDLNAGDRVQHREDGPTLGTVSLVRGDGETCDVLWDNDHRIDYGVSRDEIVVVRRASVPPADIDSITVTIPFELAHRVVTEVCVPDDLIELLDAALPEEDYFFTVRVRTNGGPKDARDILLNCLSIDEDTELEDDD